MNPSGSSRSLEETTIVVNDSSTVYYGSKEFMDRCIAEFKVEAGKKGPNKQKPMVGAYGHVFKIRIDGVPYFLKTVVIKNPDADATVTETDVSEYNYQQWLINNEINVSKHLSTVIPDSVSLLIGAYFKVDPKFTRSFLIYEGSEGMNLAQYLESLDDEDMETRKYLYCNIKHIQRDLNRVGFVHRDIKPENIYVLTGSGRSQCKLIDFGSAVPIGYTGRASGSALYMPDDMKPVRWRPKNISGYEGHAVPRQNDFAVDTIWTKDFGLDRALMPNCSSGGSRRKTGVKTRKVR